MSEAIPESAPAAPQEPVTPTPAGSAVPEPVGEPQGATPPWGDDANFDPERAWKLIQNLRGDVDKAAAAREAANAAAESARNDLAQQIGRAIGLVQDDTPVDASDLTQQLTAAQQATREAALELAVYKAAGSTADPAALLDSRSFLQKVAGIDPSDTAAITQAITQAVTDNPAFGKASSAPTPALKPNPAQGSSAQPPLGLAEQAQAAQAAGNFREAMRIKARMAAAGSDQ